nr:anaphase-promoting complex subunit 4 [Quercus suber]
MLSVTPPLLLRVSSRYFPHPLLPLLTAYSTTHDLLAVVSTATPGDVLVFRLNSQPVFSVKRPASDVEDAVVSALEWKPDGAELAIGWSDGFYGVYDGQAGMVMGTGTVRDGGEAPGWRFDLEPVLEGLHDEGDEPEGEGIALFGWAEYDLRKKGGGRSSEPLSTEDWADGADEKLQQGQDLRTDRGGLEDLTNALTRLDVTKVLPRLSGIPTHGIRPAGEGMKFVSQAATDGIFQAQKDSVSEKVEILLVCGSQGTVRVLMDHTVKIGTCHIDSPPFMHKASVEGGEHVLLSRKPQQQISATVLSLPIDMLGGSLHHVVVTNTKRIQNLLAYITHTIRCINHDLITGLQFPGRLISNMNEELAEKQEGDVVSNLYHLAMTTDFTPVMLEWLVDIVKETNHKRWDQAVNTMYTNIQNHIFIHLLPALDRLSIATTTLRGHAQHHEGTSRFDVPVGSFTKILDGIDSLRLVGQKLQLIVMAEHKQFKAFSKWLRIMVDVGVAGPGSKSAVETEEREIPNLDYPLLLAYIKNTLMESKLSKHTNPRPKLQGACTWDEFISHPTIAQMSYDRTKEALLRMNLQRPTPSLDFKGVADVDALLNLPALAVYLAGHVKFTLGSITTWQSKMLKPPTHHLLPEKISEDAVITELHGSPTATNIIFAQPDPLNVRIVGHCHVPHSVHHDQRPALQQESITLSSPKQLVAYSSDTQILYTILHDQILLLFTSRGSPPTYSIEKFTLVINQTESLHEFSAPDFIPDALQRNPFHLGPRPVAIVFGNQGREWRAFDLSEAIAR